MTDTALALALLKQDIQTEVRRLRGTLKNLQTQCDWLRNDINLLEQLTILKKADHAS